MVKKYKKVKDGYERTWPLAYFSKRYGKFVFVPTKYFSDGATGAIDIVSDGWWIHDKLKKEKKWEDGTYCSNWQASCVLSDILLREKRYFRSVYWWFATLIWGIVK